MKNLKNLGEVLNKKQQKEINGGGGPCGNTKGMVVADFHCQIGSYGSTWYNGKCYACY